MNTQPTCEELKKRIAELENVVLEQQRTIERLKGHMDDFTLYLDVSGAGVWWWHVQKNQVFFNERFQNMLGYHPGELPADLQGWKKYHHVDELDEIMEKYQRHFNGEIPYFMSEHRVAGKSGQWIWLLTRGKVANRDDEGRPEWFFGIAVDITHRKKAEKALLRSKYLLEQSQKISDTGSYSVDLKDKKVIWSRQQYRLFGYEPGEIEPDMEFVLQHIHPDDKNRFIEANDAFFSGKSEYDKTYRIIRKDGEVRWFHSRASLELDTSGKPVRTYGALQDITEKRRAEEAFIREKTKAEKYLELADVMFIGLDEKGNINLANRKACEVLEYTHDKIVGMDWFNGFIPGNIREHVRSVYYELMSGNSNPLEYYENPVISRTGKKKIIAWHNIIEKDDDGRITGTISSGEDITIRKKLENQLLQAQKLEAVSTLAGGIAHDFNNMLSVIMGNISYVLTMLDETDELYKTLFNVQEGAKRAQTLTQQLLTFARGGEPIKKSVYLNGLVEASAVFVTRGANTRCVFEFQEDLWAVEIDEGQINQVIGNLVINAVQAMPDGGTITISTENTNILPESGLPLPSGRYVKTTVKDQGTGIPEQDLPRIFDPFFTTKPKGNGLGLATAYSIINRHGGKLMVESGTGEGATFMIYLPVSETPVIPHDTRENTDHHGAGRILVMDDQESILEVFDKMLSYMGYDTLLAKDGDEAVKVYRDAYESGEPIDLVILDLTVPGGQGGAKALPELLKIDPGVKVVVASGYSNDPIMANYREYGFCGVLPKPFRKDQLAKLLNEVFDDLS